MQFYLHIQFVPRSKHVRSRLHKPTTSCRIQKYALLVLTAKQTHYLDGQCEQR